MDRKKRSRQAAFSNDQSDALHQPAFDFAFYSGDDYFNYPIGKKVGRESQNKNLFYFFVY
jgi:hypothetical protein